MAVLSFILTIDLKENKPYTRFWYLSHQYAAMAKASLHICADMTEPSLLACTKYKCSRRIRPKVRPLGVLFDLILYAPVNNFSVISGQVFWS